MALSSYDRKKPLWRRALACKGTDGIALLDHVSDAYSWGVRL